MSKDTSNYHFGTEPSVGGDGAIFKGTPGGSTNTSKLRDLLIELAGEWMESYEMNQFEAQADETLKIVKQFYLDKVPNNKTRHADMLSIEKELFQFDDSPRIKRLIAIGRINGYNQALKDVREAFDE